MNGVKSQVRFSKERAQADFTKMTEKKKLSVKIDEIIQEVSTCPMGDTLRRDLLVQVVRFLNVANGSMRRYEKFTELTKRKVYVLGNDGDLQEATEGEIMRLIAEQERRKYNEEVRNYNPSVGTNNIIDEVASRRYGAADLQKYDIFRETFAGGGSRGTE